MWRLSSDSGPVGHCGMTLANRIIICSVLTSAWAQETPAKCLRAFPVPKMQDWHICVMPIIRSYFCPGAGNARKMFADIFGFWARLATQPSHAASSDTRELPTFWPFFGPA